MTATATYDVPTARDEATNLRLPRAAVCRLSPELRVAFDLMARGLAEEVARCW